MAWPGMVAVLVLTAVVAVPAARAQSSCPDAAGDHLPFDPVVAEAPAAGQVSAARMAADADDPYALVLNGGGWGHGIGMSQYGARGAALLGCTHADILATYFPGTTLEEVDTAQPVRVGLWPNTPSGSDVKLINVANVGEEPVPWDLEPPLEGIDPPTQPVGETWTVWAEAGAEGQPGGFTLRTGPQAGAPIVWPPQDEAPEGQVLVAGSQGSVLSADLDPARVHLSSKSRTYQRGTLEFTSRAAEAMSVVVELPTVEQYLFGLGEVPASWPVEALAAQAVAGRSYVQPKLGITKPNCLCTVWDSVYDQAYVGAGQDVASWREAVQETAGTVLGFDSGEGTRVVQAYYSSSNGGASSDAGDIWGTPTGDGDPFAYLRSVNTATWEQVDATGGEDGGPDGLVDNPRHRWSVGWSADDLAAMLGFDEVSSVRVVERASGGRPCRARSVPLDQIESQSGTPCADRDLDGDGTTEPANGVEVIGQVDGATQIRTYRAETGSGATGVRQAFGLWSSLVGVEGQSAPLEVPPFQGRRRAGDDRVATALALSNEGWDTSRVAVLARMDDPADALAGSGLAGALDAPLLLTRRDELLPEVAAELQRLAVDEVVLLGGRAALSKEVGDAVTALDPEIALARVAGDDRFATAAAIADRIAPEGAERVLLVRGRVAGDPARSWPDALSVSGIAARKAAAGTPWPVVLTDQSLPTATQDVIARLAPEDVVVVGGPAVVPVAQANQLRDMGLAVQRRGGDDRYATSRLIAELDDPTATHLVLATGANFPDGLAAGPFAARTEGVLLLVPATHDASRSPWGTDQHRALLDGFDWADGTVTVVGGGAAVADAVLSAVLSILRSVVPA